MDMNSEYFQQLQVINQMLAQCSEGPERDELNGLKQNIEELLELTEQPSSSTSLDEGTSGNTQCNQSTEDFDDEYARFMSEMRAIESSANTPQSNSTDNFKDLEGKKFRAPHKHQWGQLSYHNAMVCSVPKNIPNINELEVKVLYLNPTHKEMLPCPYYFNLEKDCHFTEEQCRFSHGEPVLYSSLQDYVEPKFEKLAVGSEVLAKQSDDLWYRGKISHISKEKCLIKFDSKNAQNGNLEEIIFEHIFPLEQSGNSTDEDNASDIELVEIGYEEENGNEAINSKKQNEELINKSLLLAPDVVALGDWEKYTKGIGSKLMQKMGYIVGTGLGKDGAGIVKPVTALILPQGKSLDFCMNLKEKANNPQLFHADKHQKKSKEKSKKQRRKANKAERKLLQIEQMELHDYISYYFERSKQVIEGREGRVLREKLAVAAIKDVNVANFVIDERVKLMTMAAGELKISIQRLEDQHLETKALHRKLKQRNNDLKRLNIFSLVVQNELDRRKNNKKMVVF